MDIFIQINVSEETLKHLKTVNGLTNALAQSAKSLPINFGYSCLSNQFILNDIFFFMSIGEIWGSL